MPVRNGRWVPWAKVVEEAAAAKAAIKDEPEAEPEVSEAPAAKPRRSRAARKAAEVAVADATGANVSLDESEKNEEDQ